MKTSNLAYLYGMAAVLLWSTVATAFKLALAEYSPLQLLFIAVITSILALSVILGFQGKLRQVARQWQERPLFYLQTGLLNPFLYYLVLFKAYDLLPAQQALSLNYTWAILLPLLAVPLLGQQLRKTDLLAALIAYGGVFVIATGGSLAGFSLSEPTGIVMALTSTLLWCLYWIVNTKDKGDPVVSLMLSFLVGLPFVTVAMLVTQGLPTFSGQGLAAAVYVGLFEMGVTFVLWLMALKSSERTANISTLVFLSPVLSIGFIALVLGEDIRLSTFIGLGLILSALALQQWLPRWFGNQTETVNS
ncbi:DMT family transporter [Shewanella amazonensis]|uniref:Integral membrane domain protein n=1 Tax=Shewanella amazonensis (strain ATCC BAA-1098 / SB2B) TaxID=326297 RepID=A1S8K8_SHEAM|nr:DMT family transporter [Shewanella amazonensis]ABM00715.1 integral membrane domain protein [Shewanella amazonensis SB2B]